MLQNEASEQKIRETVDAILKRGEFQEASHEKPVTEMIQQIWESILEWIKGLFQNRPRRDIQFRPDFFNENVQAILKVVLIGMALVLLFFLIRFAIKKLYLPHRTRKSKIPKAHDFLENPDFVLERMKELMAQRKFSESFRFLFIAVLLEFHKRKVVRIEKWKTNRIYVREIASNDREMANPMQELSMIFNACCYGNTAVDEACMDLWLSFYMKLTERPI